ncbi:unnamed protein product, partial [Iphiclides podalirius]
MSTAASPGAGVTTERITSNYPFRPEPRAHQAQYFPLLTSERCEMRALIKVLDARINSNKPSPASPRAMILSISTIPDGGGLMLIFNLLRQDGL